MKKRVGYLKDKVLVQGGENPVNTLRPDELLVKEEGGIDLINDKGESVVKVPEIDVLGMIKTCYDYTDQIYSSGGTYSFNPGFIKIGNSLQPRYGLRGKNAFFIILSISGLIYIQVDANSSTVPVNPYQDTQPTGYWPVVIIKSNDEGFSAGAGGTWYGLDSYVFARTIEELDNAAQEEWGITISDIINQKFAQSEN